MADDKRIAPEDIATLRTTPLGSLHAGALVVEEKHPFILQSVEASFVVNIGGVFMLMFFYFATGLFDPTEKAFFWVFQFFFFFGCIYAGFARLFFIYARHIENEAVIRALTPNRRYKWHSLYNKDTMGNNKGEPVLYAPVQDNRHTSSPATGAGRMEYFHTMLLVGCSVTACCAGIQMFIEVMF